ncbi:parallel beta-helix domain-containing protein [Haliea sp. E1-2-M8]|uniref:parallel beta-helix domain-containing protein n=1 Tax=Haliea sp. E1-2-M8 TaxID=3064706 RepID=UPI002719BB32|nr:parallel beta-helix domain-containing protein [Haliea sp. E1-2-M8]MDO8860583.1 parallel beta-helix domain-containing protein [Haliea sp. E1-2-M8]
MGYPVKGLLALLLALGLLACSESSDRQATPEPPPVQPEEVDPNLVVVEPGEDFQRRLLEAFINAEPGQTIELPAGEFELDGALSLDVDNVTVRGQGPEQTVLNFAAQVSGGESILVTSNNVVLEKFALIDPPADGVKFKFSNGVTMKSLRVEWTCGPCASNGAYGLYPVQTRNVLIEDSVVIGASDAGIYVGQSDKIIVRRNRVSLNVAGIEIENSTNSDVYENIAENNTGGILVFDLPNLALDGERARIYDNTIRNNNTPNFAPEGNIVAIVPAGTGILAMAFDDIEVFGNRIEGNQSLAIAIVSYAISGLTTEDANYDPDPRRIHVHDNQYSDNATDPQGLVADIAGLFTGHGGLPEIVYDGLGEGQGAFADPDRICIAEAEAVRRGVLFQPGGGGASADPAFFACAHASLAEVVLDTPEAIAEGERPPTEAEIAELCTPAANEANFGAVEVSCRELAGYNLFADALDPRGDANGGILYDLTSELFTDYAEKYRFIFLPEGLQAAYATRDVFDFPVGTIIAKTFTMPNDFLNPGAGEIIIETRLLIHRRQGWATLPYIWREDSSGADLTVAGGRRTLQWIHSDGMTRSTEYVIPDANSCKTCHGVTRAETGSGVNQETVNLPIGPKARFLNRDNSYAGKSHNQLTYMAQLGGLAGLPRNLAVVDRAPDWEDLAQPLQERTKAYLDINCAHCHSPGGFASNSGMFLEFWREVDSTYGICKPPVAAGAGSGGLQFDFVPGDADASITVFRMDSNDPDVRMPEIGRSIIHDEAVELVREWLNSLSKGCQT